MHAFATTPTQPAPDITGQAAPLPVGEPAPDTAAFLLRGEQTALLGRPMGTVVAAPADRLGTALAPLLRQLPPQARVAGVLPFDRAAPSHLRVMRAQTDATGIDAWLRMQALGRRRPSQGSGEWAAAPSPRWTLQPEPTRTEYQDSVARCLRRLQADNGAAALRKVVLARTLLAQADAPINPWWLACRLGMDPGVLRFVAPLPVGPGEAPAWLVGATPERLLASAKDQQEHRYVVQAIADLLAPLCRQLSVPAQPTLRATASLWHLGTRIAGTLKDLSPEALAHTSSAALAALLHPTPAVCGTPRAQAAQAIAALEPVPRGFYAGAVGWCDAHGDGDWHVSLRCARVQGHEARLFAGAGIVAGSSPEAEGAETRAKFNAMLQALGASAPGLELL